MRAHHTIRQYPTRIALGEPKKLKAVILCAKKKEGMFPFSESKPTGLMPVNGKPLVKHLIKSLDNCGINEIYLVTNHKEEDFREKFEESLNTTIVHQENLKGTASAVETCDFIEEDFLVINGDVIVSENDLSNLINKHDKEISKVTMLGASNDHPEKFGVLSITNDRVDKIAEKPDSAENNLINTGIYIFTPKIFKAISKTREKGQEDLSKAVNNLLKNESARFELIEDYWIDIGTPQKLVKADKIRRTQQVKENKISEDAEIHEAVQIKGNAVIERGAEIEAGTVLEGCVFIGRNSKIGPNTIIKDSSIGPNTLLKNATVENSILFEFNALDPYTFIENSIIGEETAIKSGTVIRESFIGARSHIEMNNSIRGVKFVPDARTDLSEISK